MTHGSRHRLRFWAPFWVVMSLGSAGCHLEPSVNTMQDYYRWIADPANGLVKTRSVNGLSITVRYLPPEYLAYREMKGQRGDRTVCLEMHQSSATFVMSIFPDHKAGTAGDVMFRGVANYQEYRQRAFSLNFRMQEFVMLNTEGGEHHPVLTTLENTYGIREGRNFICVFAPSGDAAGPLRDSEILDFVYEDEFFGLGTNHFAFRSRDLMRVPPFPWSG